MAQEQIQSTSASVDRSSVDGLELSEVQRSLALSRRPIVERLLQLDKRTVADVAIAAEQLGCCQRTTYQILRRYGLSRRLSDLISSNRRGPAKSRLSHEIETVISTVLDEFHLSRLRPTLRQTVQLCRRRCAALDLQMPDTLTVKKRLAGFSAFEITRRREGVKKAREKFGALDGRTPHTKHPLQRVQIDHTLIDLIVVDEVHRLPLRRPWLTLAVDEFSRAILGMYLSLESPSATSVGMCIAHSALPKDEWCSRLGIAFEWPMHGRPDEIYTDNGADFRSEAVERGCESWGIQLSYRPTRTPHWGGLIERVIGTSKGSITTAPGATGASIQDRGDRKPEETAALTLKELERRIAVFIAGYYHNDIHSAHDQTPLSRWEAGIAGNNATPGRGEPMAIADPERLVLDFLPLARRKISREGIRWGGIRYMDDVLRPLIADRDGSEIIVRRDPRDVSRVFFLSPLDQRYYAIRARDLTFPNASLWEVQEARRHLRAAGRSDYDERDLHRALNAMDEIAVDAQKKTSRARKLRSGRLRVERRSHNSEGAVALHRQPASFDTEDGTAEDPLSGEPLSDSAFEVDE